MSLRNKVVSAGLVALLVAAPCSLSVLPGVAMADPASDLEAAAARLDELGAQLSSLQDQLASATTELEGTDVEIAEKQQQVEQTSAELADKRQQLGESMSTSYKSGSEGLLDFVLGSTSADELVNRIYYLDKISEQQASNIEEVRQLSERLSQEVSELEERQASQQQQVSDLQAQVDAYQASVAEATSYYQSLDAQVQAELAAQAAEQENSNVDTALGAIESGQGQQSGGEAAGSGDQGSQEGQGDSGEQEQPPEQTTTEPDTDEPSDGGSQGGFSGGGSSVGAGQGLATAYAQIGKAYVYGTAGPDTFDCSGLVCYCFGYARGRSTTQMISSLQASGDWVTDMSQLQVGDLVFPTSGHVGIYVGNGRMIHAANPAIGVVEAPVYSFIGGGSYY